MCGWIIIQMQVCHLSRLRIRWTSINSHDSMGIISLGQEHVAYQRLDFPHLKLTVVGGRPFSCGGEQLFRKRLLSARCAVCFCYYYYYCSWLILCSKNSSYGHDIILFIRHEMHLYIYLTYIVWISCFSNVCNHLNLKSYFIQTPMFVNGCKPRPMVLVVPSRSLSYARLSQIAPRTLLLLHFTVAEIKFNRM